GAQQTGDRLSQRCQPQRGPRQPGLAFPGNRLRPRQPARHGGAVAGRGGARQRQEKGRDAAGQPGQAVFGQEHATLFPGRRYPPRGGASRRVNRPRPLFRQEPRMSLDVCRSPLLRARWWAAALWFGALILLLPGPAAAAAGFTPGQEKALEASIRDYLANKPEVLAHAP